MLDGLNSGPNSNIMNLFRCTCFSIYPLGAMSLASAFLVGEEEMPVYDLERFVVVNTRTPLGLDRVSPSVEYISGDEMDFWQDRSLVDTLERVAGVAVKESGAPGNVASLLIRGANSDQTAIFLDGRRLNPAFSGQFDLESLSVQNLESVQILKSGGSVNFGSSGIGGVIDLRSLAARSEGFGGYSMVEIGSNDYQRFGFGVSYTDESIALSLGGSVLDVNNERLNDAYEKKTVLPRVNFSLSEHLSLELIAQYAESEKQLPGSLSGSSVTDFQESENWLLSPGVRYATGRFGIHFFYSRSEYAGEGESYGQPFYNVIEGDEVSLQMDYSAAGGLLLTAGALYRNDTIHRRDLYDNSLEQSGFFGQVIWELTDLIEMRGGVRFDQFSDYDGALTGSFEVIYYMRDDLSLFAKISSSYAPPSAQDLAYDENLDNSGNPIDTPIEPEKSGSYEIGIRQQLLDNRLEWSMLLFRNEIDELIVYEDYSYYDANWNDIYVGSDTFNVESATTEGAEIQASYAFVDKMFWSLSYTYLTALNDDLNVRLLYRPRHLLQLGCAYDLLPNLSLGISMAGQFDREGGYIYNGQVNYDIEDFVTVGVNIAWNVDDRWDVFARVGNLFDESYEVTDGYPALGRSGYIGARYKF